MDGGGHQHALAVLAGELENGVVDVALGGVVQQEIVAPAGDDGHIVVGHHVVQLVGVQPGGVDDHFRLHVALDGGYLPAAVDLLDVGDLAVKLELHAVAGGVLRQGEGEAEGAHNAAGGGVQRRHRLVADVGLHLHQLIPLHDAQALHSVGHAVGVQLVQRGAVLLAHHHHQRAVLLVGEVQLPGQLGHEQAARHVQLGH